MIPAIKRSADRSRAIERTRNHRAIERSDDRSSTTERTRNRRAIERSDDRSCLSVRSPIWRTGPTRRIQMRGADERRLRGREEMLASSRWIR
jgi:hypothetical protein